MRILVTGSNGFIGGRVAADAVERGWEVVGLGRAARPTTPVSDYVQHDLRLPLHSRTIPGSVDAVVHCAALAAPWAPPRAFVAANVEGTRSVVRWAMEHGGAPHLAYVSSSSVHYRDRDQLDLTESSPIPPDAEQINVYARTKRIGERIVERYPGSWTVLRPRAVFGPGDTSLLPRIADAARKGVLPVLEPADGPRVRCDVAYVDTIAHYLTQAVEVGASGAYVLTNAEPVELYPFLLGLLEQLGIRPRARRVPVGLATALAGTAERVSATLLGYREPPVTRFGVSVLARSKTFDVTRTLDDLGQPWVNLDEGVRRLVAAHG
ncbi:MAG: NAD(P)-dependent oxidoreductase [Cellulomonadaceae bacterium]|nr:NAD(P)-dependent oxidoreductase [Cellulomonadaceae bacterium]